MYTMALLPPGRTVPIDVPVHGSARSVNRLNIGTRASSGFNFTVLVSGNVLRGLYYDIENNFQRNIVSLMQPYHPVNG